MTAYLLDTSVLSVLAPGRPDATPEFLQWVRGGEVDLFMSVVSIAEVEQGIAKLRRQRGVGRASGISAWLEDTLSMFGGNVLVVDEAVAREAGRVAEEAIARGRHPGLADVYIAATAKAHDLTLLTRNLRHFEPLGISVADPLVSLPD